MTADAANDSPAHRGLDVLNDPLLNKGTAFTLEERKKLRIEGRVPPGVETIEEQLVRTRHEFDRQTTALGKHIYLRALQDSNEVLFLRFVQENLDDTLPIVYTPTVGEASQQFSLIYRRPRGLFLSWASRERMRDQLASIERPVDVIVATDGQRILGLGDQGAGGMGIPIGKLSLYSAFGGIDPARTLPIMLDVGTNNEDLINDATYLGERHSRLEGAEYDAFVDQFVDEVRRRWPHVLLQWEDFGQDNATRVLKRHRNEILSFNDDIQGTAAVAVAVLTSAVRQIGASLAEQRICIVGAGSAGTGIGTMIETALVRAGATDVRERLVLVDADGVVDDGRSNILDHQRALLFPAELSADWSALDGETSVETTVRHFKPTVLIGVSGVPGLFTEPAIRSMTDVVEHPIVLPLSNPTSRAEATAEDVLTWSDGKAVVATGSPFDPVTIGDTTYTISQSNNVYIFPGVGLGVLASKATVITDEMLLAAADAVAESAENTDRSAGVLPPIAAVPDVSVRIAHAVARVACGSGAAASMTDDEIDARINEVRWQPHYS